MVLFMSARGIEGRILAAIHSVAVEEVLVKGQLSVNLNGEFLLHESFHRWISECN